MRVTVLAGMALFAVGCASHPAPTDQVASSLAAVAAAQEAGAKDVPEAELHLRLAEEQITKAKQLMEEDENARAEDLASRAYQDAELALALARENQAKQRLEQFAQANQGSGGEVIETPQGTGQQQPAAPTTQPTTGGTVTQ